MNAADTEMMIVAAERWQLTSVAAGAAEAVAHIRRRPKHQRRGAAAEQLVAAAAKVAAVVDAHHCANPAEDRTELVVRLTRNEVVALVDYLQHRETIVDKFDYPRICGICELRRSIGDLPAQQIKYDGLTLDGYDFFSIEHQMLKVMLTLATDEDGRLSLDGRYRLSSARWTNSKAVDRLISEGIAVVVTEPEDEGSTRTDEWLRPTRPLF